MGRREEARFHETTKLRDCVAAVYKYFANFRTRRETTLLSYRDLRDLRHHPRDFQRSRKATKQRSSRSNTVPKKRVSRVKREKTEENAEGNDFEIANFASHIPLVELFVTRSDVTTRRYSYLRRV